MGLWYFLQIVMIKKAYFPYLLPFAAFLVLTYAGALIPDGTYLFYPIKTLVVGALLFYYRRSYTELHFKWSWLAVLVGIAAFVIWVLPEGIYPHLGWSRFNPYPVSFQVTDETLDGLQDDGIPQHILQALESLKDQEIETETTFLKAIRQRLEKKDLVQYRDNILSHAVSRERQQWVVILLFVFRFLGAVIVVPIVEELFWRSFALRWIIDENFTTVPIGAFTWFSFLVIVLGFGFEHHRWLVGLAAGVIYNGLLYYKKDLSACVLAHAVTNLLLGVYVLLTQQWNFW